jgi:hypothetical protein
LQSQNVVLILEVDSKRIDQVGLEKRAFCYKGVDLLLFDLPANPVNQQRHLDGVKLAQHRVIANVLSMQNFRIDFDELVHLLNVQFVKMLVDEEQLYLVVLY